MSVAGACRGLVDLGRDALDRYGRIGGSQRGRRESGSSRNGSIPDAYAALCKSIRKEKPRERRFCKAL
jgi:hypothetical protein